MFYKNERFMLSPDWRGVSSREAGSVAACGEAGCHGGKSVEQRLFTSQWLGSREEKEGARTGYTEGLVARFPTGSISVCVRTSDTSAWSGVRTQLSKDRHGQGKGASHLWAY